MTQTEPKEVGPCLLAHRCFVVDVYEPLKIVFINLKLALHCITLATYLLLS